MQPQVLKSLAAVIVLSHLAGLIAHAHPGPGIVVDRKGQLYFVHGVRHRIMKVDAAGKLSVFVQGKDGGKLSLPHHLVLDREDNLYAVGDRDGVIWKITPDLKTVRVYPPTDWYGITFVGSGGDPFTIDAVGNIYGTNSRRDRYSRILKISPDGRIAVVAGGDYGIADGKGAQAKLGELHDSAFAWGVDGSLYLTDSSTSIRKITPDGLVTTVVDSSGKKVRLRGAAGVACDAHGNLYVADSAEKCVYKITADGRVSALAGSARRGGDGRPDSGEKFDDPVGVAVTSTGAIYVLDYLGDDPRVRKISLDGMVTTVATTEKTR